MSTILGVQIDQLTFDQIRQKLEQFLGSGMAHHIVTANPEMLVAAHRNPVFQNILRRADLVVADGVGILWAAKTVYGESIPERITGNDLLALLIDLANAHDLNVYFIGGETDQAERAAQAVRGQHPRLQIRARQGGAMTKDVIWHIDPSVIEDIKAQAPDILVVALGHEKQETWIHDFLPELPSVRAAIGVGGAFAFLSGDVPRAPRWMQRAGLEWLWRLMQEPSRFGRIFTAVIVFPVLVIWDKIKPQK